MGVSHQEFPADVSLVLVTDSPTMKYAVILTVLLGVSTLLPQAHAMSGHERMVARYIDLIKAITTDGWFCLDDAQPASDIPALSKDLKKTDDPSKFVGILANVVLPREALHSYLKVLKLDAKNRRCKNKRTYQPIR